LNGVRAVFHRPHHQKETDKAFAGSVEHYQAFCKARGEDPERPFSGQFVVRAAPSLHKAMFSAAKRAGMSLNKWVTSTLERAVSRRDRA
jgi:predicted HicB family RNase H-like nuclease